MMNDRHQPKHYRESTKDACNYCRRTPAVWNQVGNEKVCAHCGTRVYRSSAYAVSHNLLGKSADR